MKKQKVLQVAAAGTIGLSAILGSNVPVLAVEESNVVDEDRMEEKEIGSETDGEQTVENTTGPEELLPTTDQEAGSETKPAEEDGTLQLVPEEKAAEAKVAADPGSLPGLSGNIEYVENGYRLHNTGGNNLALSTVSGKAFQFEADIEYVNGQNVSLVFGHADNKFFGLEFKREDNGNIFVKLFQDGPGGLGDGVISYVGAGTDDGNKKIHVRVAADDENSLSIAVNGTPVAFEFAKDFKGNYEGGLFGLLTWNTEAVVSNIVLDARAIPEAPKSNFITNVSNLHGLQGTWKETEEGLYSSGNGDNFARSDTLIKNVQFSANVRSVNQSGAGTIAIRTKDNPRDGGYYLNVDYSAHIFKLFSFPSGGTIASVPMGQVAANEDGSYDLMIQMVEDHLRVFANGTGIMDVRNTEHAEAGYLSLLTWNDTVVYQNVLYEELEAMEEMEEPQLTGLEVLTEGVHLNETIDPAVTLYGLDVEPDVHEWSVRAQGNGTISAIITDRDNNLIRKADGADNEITITDEDFRNNFLKLLLTVTNSKGFAKTYTFTTNKWVSAEEMNQEKYRPQFHVSPINNFMNDPNGMVYDSTDGYWHMFYQYQPHADGNGNQSWGHVRSKDLVNWEQMPLAIQEDDNGLIFSGCAIEDRDNTSGYFTDNKEGESRLIAYFTYHNTKNGKQSQAMAYSKDHGLTWKKCGIILDNSEWTLSGNDFRDPKVFRVAGDNDHWYMVTAGGAAQIFVSTDLKEWTRSQNMTYLDGSQIHSECPMMFPAVDEETGEQLWVYGGSAGFYVVGKMEKDDKGIYKWHAVSEKLDVESNANPWGGFGKYATMTFYNPDDERTIGVSWLQDFVNFDQKDFKGVQSLPQSYSVKKINGSYVIVSDLVKEVDLLRNEEPIYSAKKTVGPEDGNILQGVSGITYDLEAVFTPKDAEQFGFRLRKGNGQEIVYSYDAVNHKMNVDVSNAGPHQSHGRYSQTLMPDENGQIRMRIVVDQGAVEAFGNNGEANISTVVYCDPANIGMEFFTDGQVQIDALDIYDMKSMYTGEGNFLGQQTRLVLDAPVYARPGEPFTVNAQIYPNAAVKDIEWSAEGLEIVKRSDTSLVLKADAPGEYTIRANVGDLSREASVVVDDPQFIHNTTDEWKASDGSWSVDHQGLKANNLGNGDCFYLSDAVISKNEPFTITTNLKVDKGQAIGVVFGVKDPDDPSACWYCANIDTVTGVAKMFKNMHAQLWDVSKNLDQIPSGDDGFYTIVVEYDGQTLTYTVNGVEIGSRDVSQDADFEKGNVGFVSYKANGTIKDLVIDSNSPIDEKHLQSVKDKHAGQVYEITDLQSEEDLRDQLPVSETLKRENGTVAKRNISWDLRDVEFGTAGEYEAYGMLVDDTMPIDGSQADPDLVSTVRITPTVNKDELKDACEKAKNIVKEDYTPQSVKGLEDVYAKAVGVLEKQDATQDEVDKALDDLNAAIKALVKKADKSKLNEAIGSASQLKESDYTPDSWKVFEEALNEAVTVSKDENAVQNGIDAAADKLTTAQKTLQKAQQPAQPEVVDKSRLNEAIESANKLNGSDYTPDSWKVFAEALNTAKDVAKKEDAVQDDVDAAHDALTKAQKALTKVQTNTPASADKTKLEESIKKAEGLNKADYTEKSWNKLVDALKQAKEIAQKSDASQAEIDQADQLLSDTIKALVRSTGNQSNGSTSSSTKKSSANTSAMTGMSSMIATAGASLLGIVTLLKKRNRK